MTRRLLAIFMCLSVVLVFAVPSLAQEVTPEPTAEETVPPPEVTVEPTVEITVEPTAEVTVEPTGEVTSEPVPTEAPTEEPTAEATAELPPPAMPIPDNAILTGLNFPRGIGYDDAGNLYVAEAGLGGSELLFESPTPDFPDATGGLTSRITVLNADGTQWVPLNNLFSAGTPDTETLGATAVLVSGNSLWIAVGGNGPVPSHPYADAVIEVDMTTWRIQTWIDLYAHEVTVNPDGADPFDTNVNDIALGPDGTLYIMDTGANALFSWTEEAGLAVVQVWADNPVPTSMAFDANGDLYVGFLGEGLAPGAAKIEHWSADGTTLIETFGGLNTITDVAVGADGNIYAVSLIQFGEQGPVPNSGSVIMVSASGTTVVAEGLPQPYSLAQAPDGSWAVSVNTVFAPPGAGMVLTIGGGM